MLLTTTTPAIQQEASAATPATIDVFAIGSQPLSARHKGHIRIRRSRLNVLAGHVATVNGTLRPHTGGLRVALRALHGRHWVPVAHATTGARGRFRLRYEPKATGSWRIQVRIHGNGAITPSKVRLGRLSAYRLADASWYGGGGETACGSELTSATMGVANKTLPCGTPVTLRYHGHTVTVPVIDRGPYVEGREYDLTEATKQALGFEGVAEVWATR
ncbi:MAG TPA: septal ring lytic transglycosylase RlpA family protein [Solirubrobacteraceae bacterium]|jgi:hypothetical protein